MNTTSIIAELLIIGFFTAVWILLGSVRLGMIRIQDILVLLREVQPTSGALIIGIVSYHLGLVMNEIANRLTKWEQSRYQKKMIEGTAYESIATKVREKGSDATNRMIELRLSFVRLTRAGMINFLMISLILFSFFNGRIVWIGVVSLFMSYISFIAWRKASQGYYRRLAYAYQEITGQKTDPELFPEGSLVGFFFGGFIG